MDSSIETIYRNFQSFMDGRDGLAIRRHLNAQSASSLLHPLGAWVILYTPFRERPPLMIIGNNPSWFDDGSREAAKRNLSDVAGRVPSVNSYLAHNHAYARALQDAFIIGLGRRDLLESCVGLNRFWVQTGGDFSSVRPKRDADPSIHLAWKQAERLCEEGTRRIIDMVRPRAVALVGGPASSTVPDDFRLRRASEIVFRDCRHPARGGGPQFRADIGRLIKDAGI